MMELASLAFFCVGLVSFSQIPIAAAAAVASQQQQQQQQQGSSRSTYDLQILTVTRTWNMHANEDMMIDVEVNFTASVQPQTLWTYAGVRGETAYLSDTQLRYDGFSQGQALASFPMALKMVTLRIGYWDSHYLRLFIRRDWADNMTQTLNTRMSTVQPGYDVSYTPGDSFQVVASVPYSPGENFTWYDQDRSPEKQRRVRLEASYVDSGDRIWTTENNVNQPDMGHFLQTQKTYGEDGVDFEMDFNMANERVNGYFEVFTMSTHPSYMNDEVDQLVIEIWESIWVKVHEASITGPFPDDRVYVDSDYDTDYCERGSHCDIYCHGFANHIDHTAIYKVGSSEPLSDDSVYRRVVNSYHVVFHAHFEAREDYAGNYTCKAVSPDGEEGQTIVQVVEF